jgi:hypothetical protein
MHKRLKLKILLKRITASQLAYVLDFFDIWYSFYSLYVMYLYEFNNLDLEDKYDFIWRSDGAGLKCFRDDGDYRYILFDCGTFLAEKCLLKGKVIKIEGFELTDIRVNHYIRWVEEHQDDPNYQLSQNIRMHD